jgi:hypothetical protein
MKTILSHILTLLLLFLAANLIAQSDQLKGVESITKAELRDHIYFLASDYLKGRVGTSPEYEIAAQYTASQFASGKLQAIESNKQCMDGYFQNVPFQKIVLDKRISMILSSKEGEQEFLHNEHYKVWNGTHLSEESLEVVFVGYGIQEPELGWDDLEGLDVEGKMVIMMSGPPINNGEAVFPDSIHQKYLGRAGFQARLLKLFEQRPAALFLALDTSMRRMFPFSERPSSLEEVHYQYQGYSAESEGPEFPMIYFAKDDVIQMFFQGQKSSPALIEEKGLNKYRTFQLEDVRVETHFPVLESKEINLKNVVAVVPGTDPELSKEYITVGAHLDHVTLSSGQVANGADDNASGCAGVMEIAEAVAMDPPRRSVVFITYTAEEMGIKGSHFFVNSGPIAIEDIKFNVNLDMIGRTEQKNMETRAHMVSGPPEFKNSLVPFISDINEKSVNWSLIYDFDHRNIRTIVGSDHYNYAKHGIPYVFFSSGLHEDIHGPGDDPEKIEYDKVTAISQLAYLITMKLANMDEVPSFVE